MDIEKVNDIAGQELGKLRAFLGPDASSQSALLPVLHAVQAEFGFVAWEAFPVIADALNISQAEVRGVVSFYHDFRLEPAGRHVLKICKAEACQSMGCDTLAAHIEARHALKPGETMPDGSLTIENVYCLGNCGLAPAALLDDELIGRVTCDRIDSIFSGARK